MEIALTRPFAVNPKALEERLRTACANVILLEPKLTEWDTIMGDGGALIRGVVPTFPLTSAPQTAARHSKLGPEVSIIGQAIELTLTSFLIATLKALDLGLASTGSLFTVVHRIVQITESAMGGTLGAIFGIYLAGFLSALRSNAKLASASTGHSELLSRASVVALERYATSSTLRPSPR